MTALVSIDHAFPEKNTDHFPSSLSTRMQHTVLFWGFFPLYSKQNLWYRWRWCIQRRSAYSFKWLRSNFQIPWCWAAECHNVRNRSWAMKVLIHPHHSKTSRANREVSSVPLEAARGLLEDYLIYFVQQAWIRVKSYSCSSHCESSILALWTNHNPWKWAPTCSFLWTPSLKYAK